MANRRLRFEPPLTLGDVPFEISLEGGAATAAGAGFGADGSDDGGGSPVGALLQNIIPPPTSVTFGNPPVFFASSFLNQSSIDSQLISPTFTGGIAPFTLLSIRVGGGGPLPGQLTYTQVGLGFIFHCTQIFVGSITVTYADALGRQISGDLLLGLGNFGAPILGYTRMGGWGGFGSAIDLVDTNPFSFTPPGDGPGFTYLVQCVAEVLDPPFAVTDQGGLVNGIFTSGLVTSAPFTGAFRLGGSGVSPCIVYGVGYVFAQKQHPAPFTDFASDMAMLTFQFT